jgi:hypothetical protein
MPSIFGLAPMASVQTLRDPVREQNRYAISLSRPLLIFSEQQLLVQV